MKGKNKLKQDDETEMKQVSNLSSNTRSVNDANSSMQNSQLSPRENERNEPALLSTGNLQPIQNERVQNVSFLQRILSNKKVIFKWFIVVLLLVGVMWMGFSFLEDISKTRKPMFLSSYSTVTVTEMMSPQESDYQSFRYFEQMTALASKIAAQDREATNEELKQFDSIKFKQFFNAYKVIRTIQLGKEFEKTQKDKEELIPDIDSTSIDQYINQTEYFADAADQFSCSSCYSFPIAATVEYLYNKKFNTTIKLSEQQLIDCAHQEETKNGCENGNITKGFEYVKNKGLVSAGQYPYRSITGFSFKCDQQTINKTQKLYKISGFKKLPLGNCQAIQRELVKGNVVAAMINGGGLSSYSSGVFTDCKRFEWNHAITIVGQTEKNEWIVRNSWGKGFGNNGYFIMGRGNTCGVCAHAIVPILNLDEKGNVIPYDPRDEEKKEPTHD